MNDVIMGGVDKPTIFSAFYISVLLENAIPALPIKAEWVEQCRSHLQFTPPSGIVLYGYTDPGNIRI